MSFTQAVNFKSQFKRFFNPSLGILPPCWFSLNKSETVKAVTLAFCSIQQHFIKDICVIFGISNSPQSP